MLSEYILNFEAVTWKTKLQTNLLLLADGIIIPLFSRLLNLSLANVQHALTKHTTLIKNETI